MSPTVRVVFGLLFYLPPHCDEHLLSAFLHGQPSLRAVFFQLQVVLHEQDCIQIKTISQWPVFKLQSTKNSFEYSLKNTQNTPLDFHEFHYVSCYDLHSVCFHFLPNGNHTRLQNHPLAANHEYLQNHFRGHKPCLNTNCLHVSIKTDLNNGCSDQ